MYNKMHKTFWALGLTLLVGTPAYAGITVYNPQTGKNESVGNGQSQSIGGVRQNNVATPQAQQQQRLQQQLQYQQRQQQNTNQLLFNNKVQEVHNANTVIPRPYKQTQDPKVNGEILLFLRPAENYKLDTMAALARLFQDKSVATEYYSVDLSPQEIARSMAENNRKADRYSGPAPSEARLEFYAQQINQMPSPSVDAENMLSRRYGIKSYPTVIYTDPKGKITRYNLAGSSAPNRIVDQILSKVDYVKRGQKVKNY